MVRQARQSRPQLVVVLADNSGSMAGEKAQAATQGIREMLMECQSRGPDGPDRSYFKLLLIRFDHEAVIDPLCDMTPVRSIDPDRVSIDGRGGQTDITAALELALMRLKPYMQALQQHRNGPSIRCPWCSCSPTASTTSAPGRSRSPRKSRA